MVETKAGLRPGTPDNAPLIGPGRLEGLLLATGHYRNGMLMAPVTAEAIAALLAAEPLPDAVEAAHPGRFTGEGPAGPAPAPALKEAPR